MTFKYNKDGDITNRVFFALTSPSDKYFGVDITELDIEDQGSFIVDLEDIVNEQREKISKLMEQYDIKHRYRSFFQKQMTEVIFD